MTSIFRQIKESSDLRRQFAVYPYYNGGKNQFFTCLSNTLYRIDSDLSGVDYVIARDMGTQMPITAVDSTIITNWTTNLGNVLGANNVNIVRSGTARKFQVVSMVSGNLATSDLMFADLNQNIGLDSYDYRISTIGNFAGNGTAYSDPRNTNALFNTTGNNFSVNDLLIVGEGTTTTTATTQSLPFGTFWAINDPIIISYEYSAITKTRAIKNRIDETTLF
jgi:hypothetical protein